MSATDALARIQKAARYGTIKLSSHAQEEADNGRAQANDIKRAICTAKSAIQQEEGKFRLEGQDLDGEPLTIVVRETPYGLRVITVF
jgi:hypothetical protein